MIRRKIDSRRISARRPDLSTKECVSAYGFASSLKRFADEYLKSALTVEIEGSSTSIVNISLRYAAYMLRLMVEYGGDSTVLKTKIKIRENLTIETLFPNRTPSIEELAEIAKAGRMGGFSFEIRENRIIMRAHLELGSTISVYAKDFDKVFNIFAEMFFM